MSILDPIPTDESLDVLSFLLKHNSSAYYVGYTLFQHNEKTTYLDLWKYWGFCNSIDTTDFEYCWFNVFI